jgi:hypothetical protein
MHVHGDSLRIMETKKKWLIVCGVGVISFGVGLLLLLPPFRRKHQLGAPPGQGAGQPEREERDGKQGAIQHSRSVE